MSRAKGNRTRNKCVRSYAGKDWDVEIVEKTGRFVKIKDLYGLFDLIAIKGTQVLFIQVKTNKPATQQPYIDWAEAHCNESIRCICWTWYDHKGERIQEYMPDGTIKETDNRK